MCACFGPSLALYSFGKASDMTRSGTVQFAWFGSPLLRDALFRMLLRVLGVCQEGLSENVERQGWRDRALQGSIHGRFSDRPS